MNFRSFLLETELSRIEKEMLGTKAGKYFHPTPEEYHDKIRPFRVAMSQNRNPGLNPELTAYTPGETLKIMDHPVIQQWHNSMKNYKVPKGFDTVVFVACAASKPWRTNCASSFYKAYHQLKT